MCVLVWEGQVRWSLLQQMMIHSRTDSRSQSCQGQTNPEMLSLAYWRRSLHITIILCLNIYFLHSSIATKASDCCYYREEDISSGNLSILFESLHFRQGTQERKGDGDGLLIEGVITGGFREISKVERESLVRMI